MRQTLRQFVRGLAALVLQRGLDSEDDAATFHELGFDTDRLVVLAQLTNEAGAANLTLKVLTAYPSINALADYLLESGDDDLLQRISLGSPAATFVDGEAREVRASKLSNTSGAVASDIGAGKASVNPSSREGKDALEPFPLTDLQTSFLFGRELGRPSERVGCHIYAEIAERELDVDRLSFAWNALVQHHPMLRAEILPDGRQQIHKRVPSYSLQVYDVRGGDEVSHLSELRARLSHKVYEPGAWPLFSIAVSLFDDNRAVIHFSIDELIVDGLSWHLLMRQWWRLYHDPAYKFPAPRASFREFVEGGGSQIDPNRRRRDVEYWMGQLATIASWPVPMLLEEEGSREVRPLAQRTRYESRLEATAWRAIKQRARGIKATPTSVLLALFCEAIAREGGGEAFPLLLTYLNRPTAQSELQEVVGPFTSSIIFGAKRLSDRTFAQKVTAYQTQLWEGLAHASVSGAAAVRDFQRLYKQAVRIPIVFTSFLGVVDDEELGWVKQLAYMVTQTPQVYLDQQVFERDGELYFSWDVAEAYVDVDLVRRIFATYQDLLKEMAGDDGFWNAGPPKPGTVAIAVSDVATTGGDDLAFPLSEMQAAYLYSRLADPEAGACHLYQELDVDRVDVDHLEAALGRLSDIHPMLRTVVKSDGHQQTQPGPVGYRIEVETLAGEETDREKALLSRREILLATRFTPDSGPFFRLAVTHLDARRSRLHALFDLMMADGNSVHLVMKQLLALYRDPHLALQSPATSYRQIIEEQGFQRAEPVNEDVASYWADKFGSLPAGPDLPRRADHAAVEGAGHTRISETLHGWSTVKERAAQFGLQHTAVLLCAYCDVLQSLSPGRPFTVVVPTWTRRSELPNVGEVVGDFTSLRWVVVDGLDTGSFLDRARRVQTQLDRDAANWTPGLLQRLRRAKRRQGGAMPAFPVVFTDLMEHAVYGKTDQVIVAYGETRTPQVVLDNISIEVGAHLQVSWDIDLLRMSSGAASTLFADYLVRLGRLADDVSAWDVPERHQKTAMAAALDRPDGVDEREGWLHHYIERKAALRPEAIALVFKDSSLTYAELNRAANRYANHLSALGIGPGTVVGVLAHRSPQLVVGLLAILKAGAAYLPIDPTYPEERILYLLEDASAPALLLDGEFQALVEAFGGAKVNLSRDSELVAASSPDNPTPELGPDDLCYVIYTSGSTGKPKGCMVPHKAILNRLLWMQDEYRIGEADRVLQKTPFSFDVSVWEFFWPLMAGATLVIAEPERHKDSRYLVELIQVQQITICHFVPSMLTFFLAERGVERCRSLRHVFASGEALSYSLAQKFRATLPARLHNLYGPTEAAVDVTYWECVERPDKKAPIGQPIRNIQIHILDDLLRPVPAGELGEIHIGGVGLARGYLNRPDLTAEKFIASPFDPREKLYKTGDFARMLPDGNIEYLGRRDSQVKLRGYRIELGEIESALGAHPAVDNLAVVVQDAASADPRLVAYYTPAAGQRPTAKELRSQLRLTLPEHLVPNLFVPLAAIPVTAHGKLDRARLPWPAPADPSGAPSAESAAAPELEREGGAAVREAGADTNVPAIDQIRRRLIEIASPFLHVEAIDPHADLFDCGASSLTIVKIRQAVERDLAISLSADDFIDGVLTEPTIDWIARFIARTQAARLPSPEGTRAMEPVGASEPASGHPGASGDLVPLEALSVADSYYYPPAPGPAAEPVSLHGLSDLLSLLSAHQVGDLPNTRYLFPNAGDKKAVQSYLAIGRSAEVDLPQGVYYYHPERHALLPLDEGPVHDLFVLSAEDAADLYVIFVAQRAALSPIYDKHGDYMAVVEAGYMTQLLAGNQHRHGVAFHAVSDFDTRALRSRLRLDAGHRIIGALACGSRSGATAPAGDAVAGRPARAGSELMTLAEHRAASDLASLRPLAEHELDDLQRRQLHLRHDIDKAGAVFLAKRPIEDDRYFVRACQRDYLFEPLPLTNLGRLLSLLRPRRRGDQDAYLYPSPCGVHGVETYVYVKDGRVSSLRAGLYRYLPEAHALAAVKAVPESVIEASHVPFNRRHFKRSAFTIFFVGKAARLRSVWGEAFVHSGLQEAGAMGQLLLDHQAEFGLGLCPVGGGNFERIRAEFGLDPDDCLLHQLLGGAVDRQGVDPLVNALRPLDLACPAAEPAPVRDLGDETLTQDLAIIGIAGRFPGADDLDALWEILKAGRSSIGEIPVDRWPRLRKRWDEAPEGLPAAGAFLADIDSFDSLLFSISPLEAQIMDPQERLFLETVWACLENAGYCSNALGGADRDVGVFAGVMWSDYQGASIERGPADPSEYATSFHSDIANRVSFFFDFRGPSLSVGASCASALASIHMACESLKRGECSVALAGGVNLVSHPFHLAALNRHGLLSRDGKSSAFSAEATGWVVGEGVGAVLIKPLPAAERDGDHIHAVIKASAIEHAGRTRQYRSASSKAQAESIARVLKKSGVTAADISYVETAAAGASLADAAEISALVQCLGVDLARAPCALGSIKPNLGHLESASAVSQLAKVVLQMEHRALAPSIDSDPLNPLIQLDGSRLEINRQSRNWDAFARREGRAGPLTALINSFGASGACGHLVIQEAVRAPAPLSSGNGPEIVLLSAMTEPQLREYGTRLLRFLTSDRANRHALADIAATLQTGREPMPQRLAIVANDLDELRALLRRYLERESDLTAPVFVGRAAETGAEPIQASVVGALDAARRWVAGARVQWRPRDAAHRRTPLPTYPFARRRHWIGAAPSPDAPTERPGSKRTGEIAEKAKLSGMMQAHLREVFSQASGIAVSDLRSDVPFENYGINSAMILRMKAHLAEAFGEIPTSAFFEFQTLKQLTDYLLENHPQALDRAFGTAAARLGDREPPRSAWSEAAPAVGATARWAAEPLRAADIAVIGLAGRFPQAPDIASFWENLKNGRDCITEVPDDGAHSADELRRLGLPTRGGFIDGVDRFDPVFFGIAPSWAEFMDPQERLFLETAWHAMEDAGYSRRALQDELGAQVGVFVGVMYNEYQMLGAVEEAGAWKACSPGYGSIANRVSHHLGLRGPSLAVDTMCSSSLTALHLAVESLKRGECAAAIVGGVNVLVHPNRRILHAQFNMTSPSGHCRSFGAGGDGFVPGEGVCAILIKPLAAAEADGDVVHGVIKGSAINHGGKTNGYTVPSPLAQREVIGTALAKADVDPRTISYVEAHGTGTVLGDPIEVEGLVDAFGAKASEKRRCALGSVKSNIGHLEGAAGLAAVAKVLLQMRHKKLAPSLHSNTLNPNIKLEDSPFYIPQAYGDWERPAARPEDGASSIPRRAGVSSFGAGGSNAHVILEEYDRPASVGGLQAVGEGPRLVVLSAMTEEALKIQAARLLKFLRETPVSLERVEYTLLCGRDAFDERAGFLVRDEAELLQQLRSFCGDGPPDANIYRGGRQSTGRFAGLIDLHEDVLGELTQILVKRRDLETLLRLWVGGAAIDWKQLYPVGRPTRASLPGYPFARERYWIQGAALGTKAGGHPFIDRNLSTFDEAKFATRFSARDEVLDHHRIIGRKTLPGVVQIEMARAACEVAAERRIARVRDVVWLEPAVAGETGLEVMVKARRAGASIAYEVVTKGPDGRDVVLSRGLCDLDDLPAEGPEEPGRLGVLRARCRRPGDVHRLYEAATRLGLEYGPSFRSIRAIQLGENEGLVDISLADVGPTPSSVHLNPFVLDAALQSAYVLGGDEPRNVAHIPFGIDQIELVRPLPASCIAHVRPSSVAGNVGGKRYDVELMDRQGARLVNIRGLALRPVDSGAAKPRLETMRPQTRFYRPSWRQAELDEGERQSLEPGPLVVFTDDARWGGSLRQLLAPSEVVTARFGSAFEQTGDMDYVVAADCEADYARLFSSLRERGVHWRDLVWRARPSNPIPGGLADMPIHAMTKLCRQVLKHGLEDKVKLTYVYTGKEPRHSALAGFAKSLLKEAPQLVLGLLGFDTQMDNEGQLRTLADELRRGRQAPDHVRYDPDRRLRCVEQLAVGVDSPSHPPIRHRGVYLITGGLGGVGGMLATHLSRLYRARLVLVGRSPLNAEMEAKLRALRELGGEAEYVRADVSQSEDCARVVDCVRARFGGVDGLVHVAGVTRDSLLVSKTDGAIEEVLAGKVLGARYLDQATRCEDLDFFALFSSIVGVVGNVGQTDYAYANAFLDSFVRERERLRQAGQRNGRSLSIAWPYWDGGGMALSEQAIRALRSDYGMSPLGEDPGMRAFEAALAADSDRVIVVESVAGDDDLLFGPLVGDEARPVRPTPHHGDLAAGHAREIRAPLEDYLRELVSKETKLPKARIDTHATMDRYGIDSVMVVNITTGLERLLGPVSKTLLFEFHSLDKLCDHLMRQYGAQLSAAFSEAATAHPSPADAAAPAGEALAASSAPAIHRAFAPDHGAAQADVAIIGLSGRYPMADTLQAFWENLKAGKDCITEIPASRWDFRDQFDPDPKAGGKSYSKWGGFISDVDAFDAMFFKMTPTDARFTDPQQRLFLEAVYAAVEDAGYTRDNLCGSSQERDVGVFLGTMWTDYRLFGLEAEARIPQAGHWAIPNRISYYFDFHGPSIALDTACSSSLTAIHMAIESLRAGSCRVAIAGGVNLSIHPIKYRVLSQDKFASRDGKCRSFGEGGTGYVPGEGVGAVVLKPLAASVRDGDHIYGVIKASVLNHGGKTNGFTVPNPNAQANLVGRALDQAGVDPRQITYVEAHGTGTSLGDPIEVAGLTRAFRERTGDDKQYCALGSVKSNIGHLEGAAGIASLTKVLLQLEHAQLAPSIHSDPPNPKINFEESPFYVQQRLEHWPRPRVEVDGERVERPRCAAISSFGAGGANVHLIVEEFTAPAGRDTTSDVAEPALFLLSAREKPQLIHLAANLATFLRAHEDVDLHDVAYTLQVGREAFEHRLAVVIAARGPLLEALDAYVDAGLGASVTYRPGDSGLETLEPLRITDPEDRQRAIASGLQEGCLERLAGLWVAGAMIDWDALDDGRSDRRRVSLPTYPFARERYWVPEPTRTETKSTHLASMAE